MAAAEIDFPDVSHWNDSVSLRGAPIVFVKATQGTSYVDPKWMSFKAQARDLAIPLVAYHWLDTADAKAQAANAFKYVGPDTPLMIDDEQTRIVVPHTLAFVSEYRKLGGRVKAEYAPHWVWENSGQPDLRPLRDAGLILVSSAYPSSGYAPNGIGWNDYGNWSPTIWQWTDAHLFNGKRVDFNHFRGTVDELVALLWDSGGTGMALQAAPVDLINSKLTNGMSLNDVFTRLLNRTPTDLSAQLAAILKAASDDPAVEATISPEAAASIAAQVAALVHAPTAEEIADASAAELAGRLSVPKP